MMASITIWHNAKCSKSRATLALLEQHGYEPRIVPYLDEPPSVDELRRVLKLLGAEPRAMIRTQESVYAELRLTDEHDDEVLIQAMVDNPILIQRPIVICGERAAVGRPPENVWNVLK